MKVTGQCETLRTMIYCIFGYLVISVSSFLEKLTNLLKAITPELVTISNQMPVIKP